MKRIFALSVIVLLVGVTSHGSAEADDEFDNESLEGTYGFSASGDIVAPNPLAGPATAVGLVTFDGEGGCTVSDTVNIVVPPFIVPRASVSCTYSVAPDGSGTITPTFGPPFGTTPSAFVIVDDGEGFRFIRISPTVHVSGVGQK